MQTNPYIGARAYGGKEDVGLYGRSRELNDLLGRLIAQRIVVMHSPSGAGKTSLIESALVPALEKHRFTVLPRIRVGLEVSTSSSENRYIQSTLTSLRLPSRTLPFSAGTSGKHPLVSTVRTQVQQAAPSSGVVLIFDQFEEVLTLSAVDHDAKLAFFQELGEALSHPKAWALFAMREEYLGLLESFAHHVPTRLGNRFRLDLLSPSAARQAIRGPAAERKVEFTDAAVQQLIDDLRMTKEMGPEGEAREVLGPVVEPVHLQVVCRRLWDTLQMDDGKEMGVASGVIDVPQVKRAGNVSETLRAYYRDLIASVAADTSTDERRIRHWISSQLITGGRLRNQVMRAGRRTAGLDERVIDALSNVYLVRKESRRRIDWYELAHDRLIDPIVEDNASWFATNPTELQKLAEIWATHEREKQLLLRGDALDEMEVVLGKTPDLTELEREYLETSRRVDGERREKRLRRRAKIRSGMATAVAAALTAVGWALTARQQAISETETLLGFVNESFSPDTVKQKQATEELLNYVVHVHYFERASDSGTVRAALSSLEYPLQRDQGTEGTQTNQVLYGRDVPIADVQAVARALLQGGVPIKRVSRFRTTRLWESPKIQVLAAPQLQDSTTLTLQWVDSLSTSRPTIGAYIPLDTPEQPPNTATNAAPGR